MHNICRLHTVCVALYILDQRKVPIHEIPCIAMASAEDLGPVVQSIVSLTSSLRGQLVKCFMTL